MKIHRYELPFSEPLQLKQGLYRLRQGLILQNQGAFGEVAPFPGLSRESLEDCLQRLHQPDGPVPPSLAWGLHMLEHPLSPLSRPQSWPVNALLTGPDTPILLSRAEALYTEGYRCFKLKVGFGDLSEDLARVDALLEFGNDVRLRLDANRSWSLATALEFVRRLPDEGIDYLEEPLARPEQYRELRAATPVRLALDESLAENHADTLLEMADVFVLKPMILGPQRVFELIAKARGRQVVFSSVFESGLGLRYLALLSQRTSGAAAAGLDTWRMLAEDLWLPAFGIAKGALNFSDTLFTQAPLLRLKWVRQTDSKP